MSLLIIIILSMMILNILYILITYLEYDYVKFQIKNKIDKLKRIKKNNLIMKFLNFKVDHFKGKIFCNGKYVDFKRDVTSIGKTYGGKLFFELPIELNKEEMDSLNLSDISSNVFKVYIGFILYTEYNDDGKIKSSDADIFPLIFKKNYINKEWIDISTFYSELFKDISIKIEDIDITYI